MVRLTASNRALPKVFSLEIIKNSSLMEVKSLILIFFKMETTGADITLEANPNLTQFFSWPWEEFSSFKLIQIHSPINRKNPKKLKSKFRFFNFFLKNPWRFEKIRKNSRNPKKSDNNFTEENSKKSEKSKIENSLFYFFFSKIRKNSKKSEKIREIRKNPITNSPKTIRKNPENPKSKFHFSIFFSKISSKVLN